VLVCKSAALPPVGTFDRETSLANSLDSVYLSVDRTAVVTAAKQTVASEIEIAVAAGSENVDRAKSDRPVGAEVPTTNEVRRCGPLSH
jgi:hypothetical protein